MRKLKEGEITTDLFAFLTAEPNQEVGAIHPKAMPGILTNPNEVEAWLTQPWEQARVLHSPVPDGALKIVARGETEDSATGPAAQVPPPQAHFSERTFETCVNRRAFFGTARSSLA